MSRMHNLFRPVPAGTAGGVASHVVATHVVIVGGGASGVLMALHLLSRDLPGLRVTLIEPRAGLGRGIAYSTPDPDHLLNTRVSNMSAYPDDPGHFLRWLQARPGSGAIDGQSFVSRATYGAYLTGLLVPWRQPGADAALRVVRATCTGLREHDDKVVVQLETGETVTGDHAIMATGHVLPVPDPEGLLTPAWQALPVPASAGPVIILGSGLSMVDQVLTLLRSGHEGGIVALSRRGLLPRWHEATRPLDVAPESLPLGAPVSRTLRWIRDLAEQSRLAGSTWRDAVDGIRPHVQQLWRDWPPAERARFLRHAASWWEVHRHRIPPDSARIIAEAGASGQLRLVRAAFLRAERDDAGTLQAVVRAHGEAGQTRLQASRIIDCRGIRRDARSHAAPLMRDLLDQGRARIDAFGLGPEVTEDCRLIDAEGRASIRVQALGPVTRATFWEVTAIPDIREQAARLAQGLVRRLSVPQRQQA